VASVIELLVKIQILDERQHEAVMSRAASRSGGHVVQQIAELGYATESTVARAISVELGLPRIDLGITPPEPAALVLLDARICSDRFVLPVALRENGELLWLAMADPTDLEAIGVVKRRTNKRVRPAVAGPTEILRAVRVLYSDPNAGSGKAEKVGRDKLAAIEAAHLQQEAEANEAFEVVNVADDIGRRTDAKPGPASGEEGSPLSRIARQLGVEVPPNMPSRSGSSMAMRPKKGSAPEPEVHIAHRGAPSIPPKTDPRAHRPLSFDELLSPVTSPGAINGDDLTDEDLSTLDALRASMEKGALVLRALAELCVEKGLFTREEMRKRNTKSG
jgi:type IV pilus assembly protein PilB